MAPHHLTEKGFSPAIIRPIGIARQSEKAVEARMSITDLGRREIAAAGVESDVGQFLAMFGPKCECGLHPDCNGLCGTTRQEISDEWGCIIDKLATTAVGGPRPRTWRQQAAAQKARLLARLDRNIDFALAHGLIEIMP